MNIVEICWRLIIYEFMTTITTTVSLKQIPTKKNKIVEFVRNFLGRQVQVQLREDQKSHKINFIVVLQIVSYVLHCM